MLNGKKVKTPVYKNNTKTKQLALSYKWHSPSINFLEKLIVDNFSDKDVWIDIGANLGLRSLYALSSGVKVFFIEPNKELNEINERRCKLNDFKNYQFFETGISNKKGELEFFIDESSYNSTFETQLIDNLQIEKKEIVKIDTLDNIFEELMKEFKNVFVKIDVEGHENKVIEGANHFIETLNPTMLIEINSKGEHLKNIISQDIFKDYLIYEVGNFSNNKIFNKITIESIDRNITHNDFLFIKDKKLLNLINHYCVQ